jgi:hypothetical protein
MPRMRGRVRTLVRRLPITWAALVVLVVAGLLASLVTEADGWAIAVAVVFGWVIWRIGFAILRALGTPLPPPPPPGELRKVKITYRCTICGTEVRMTSANDEFPDAPRHCQEDMELVAPIE